MITDAMTKDMDSEHLRKTLTRGLWSYTYCSDFVKAKSKPRKAASDDYDADALPGDAFDSSSPLYDTLTSLSDKPGWHVRDGKVGSATR